MACIYKYKGHTFSSELELDTFLLEKLPFEPTLGDLVFSMTSSQLATIQQLDTINNKAKFLKSKYEELLKTATYDSDGEIAIDNPPYIGVNKFLAGLKNSEGELLFPEFRKELYWSERYAKWKIGEFTEDEIREFELNPQNLPKVTDSNQHMKWREQMEQSWEARAKMGTAIHEVIQVCFQKTDDEYNFRLSNDKLLSLVKNKVNKKNFTYLNDSVIKQAIEYSRDIYNDLTYKLGEGIALFPEFMVTQDTNELHDGSPTTLMGIIDLLIIDRQGRCHILDYKTSIHGYSNFSSSKKLAYSYQLATYQRMLEKYGLRATGGQRLVAPIQLTNFRREGDQYVYDGISHSILTTNTSYNSNKMWENIDEFMKAPVTFSGTTEDALETVSEWMASCFPHFSSQLQVNRESVIEMLKKYDALKPDENGNYTWRKGGTKGKIIAKTESEFIDKVLKWEESQPSNLMRTATELETSILQAMKNGIDNADFPAPSSYAKESNTEWIKNIVSQYCDGSWELIYNPSLMALGVIGLKTKDGIYPEQIDFIKVSTNYLTNHYRSRLSKDSPLRSRKGLTGTFEPDIAQQSRSNSLMLEAANGNIELIEAMAIINQIPELEGHTIGSISVVNPRQANGISVTNEELIYCWNELNKFSPIKDNKISTGKIKFATKYEKVRGQVHRILSEGSEKSWKDGYQFASSLRDCISLLDSNIDASSQDKIKALKKLLDTLYSSTTPKSGVNPLDKVRSDLASMSSKEVQLYNSILIAIANLKGVNFRQQLQDHDKWVQSFKFWKDGVSGTYTDNPGNLDSETLNLVTKLTTEAYQNVRDDMQREKVTISKLVRDLKNEKSFGIIQEHTIGNQVDLYSNMLETTADGDYLFKNPNRLQGAERKFLEYTLYKINKNRYPTLTDEQLQEMKDSDDRRYYQVPLARGSEDSVASTSGLLATLKAKLRMWSPKYAFNTARQKLEGVFNSEEDTKDQQASQLLFSMTNMFDEGGREEKRLDKIKEVGIENLEHNLETLLYKHLFAYSIKDSVDGVFPMIKAAFIHLTTQGMWQNNEFSNDIQYLTNYIRNKILNQTIVDPRLQGLANKIGLIRSAASKFTLAFAPVQAIYPALQGLWTDISLMIRKPDGTNSFTFENFKKSLKIVYSDLFHYSDTPTVPQALNELYGNNDMDMNTYVERINQARKGIWNMNNFMFKFVTRPDFYNRMTIFVAQMLGDGCYDAHYINEDGELVYDWKKDKRFEAFANGLVNDPRYNKQRALYYTVAKQFENEHTKNRDGSDFVLNMSKPMPLPRAYTNIQAEGLKSLSDDIYGYYSHEKKSLIMSTTLGGMWLQFRNYWSGKKNQYLQSGGVRLRGRWEHYSERVTNPNTGEVNEVKYYYQVDNDGTIRWDLPPVTTETIAPVYQWKGQWQEGIILTLADMFKNMWNLGLSKGDIKGIRQGWDSKWNNEDLDLQKVYRSNLQQLVYDLTLFVIGGTIIGALLGDLLDDLEKDNKKNKDVIEGLGVTAARIAIMSVKSSFLDFNAYESVFGPLTSWTPFSISWTTSTLSNFWNVATGDEDFWDGVIKTSGALRQIKPVLDSVKPDMFRNEREGGTFGVE